MKIKGYLWIVCLIFLNSGCVSDVHESNTAIYAWKSDQYVEVSKNYSEMLAVGPAGRKASLQVNWTAGVDKAGCLKISSIQIFRKKEGGALDISNVRHVDVPGCAMKWGSEDDVKFARALIRLNYNAVINLKKYTFSGVVATLQGDGGFLQHTGI
ncbi:hypothetical protein [Pseudomonas sp. EA_5y_Pfl2_R50]|jgi:hypothetical protein|uniref:hypothetical protein n=1 Tax=Pseudomonas sp. EA_5y_Pfl2_R50 TaxID=3088691 RepID=UPI0030D993B6